MQRNYGCFADVLAKTLYLVCPLPLEVGLLNGL